MVFECFQDEIREEETQPWKRPKAQIQRQWACPQVTMHGKILCVKCYMYVVMRQTLNYSLSGMAL
jgi:hypothetical protein